MTVYQVSIHYGANIIDTVVTEAENGREALQKVLEARSDIWHPKSIYILTIADAVVL